MVTTGFSITSPVDDVARLSFAAGADSNIPVALSTDRFRSTAVTGSVAMLMVVVVGVAFGYRQARQHDAAGVDVVRFMS